jgi:Flp pilus assembly pilin Flp
MRVPQLLRRLSGDERGATVVEFAIVAPVMCLLLLGGFDFAHTLYTRAALQGVVQKVGRDSALESKDVIETNAELDDKVRKQVYALRNNAVIKIDRRFFRSFTEAAAAKPEPWTDTNGNGRCDAGEPYQDNNLNSVWDRDGGDAGQGGARDAVVYKVEMTYPRLVPINNFIGGSKSIKLEATTLLRNQPYDVQGSYAEPVVRNCA